MGINLEDFEFIHRVVMNINEIEAMIDSALKAANRHNNNITKLDKMIYTRAKDSINKLIDKIVNLEPENFKRYQDKHDSPASLDLITEITIDLLGDEDALNIYQATNRIELMLRNMFTSTDELDNTLNKIIKEVESEESSC